MTTENLIIELFCWVDVQMGAVKKHPQAKLYPSELVTIGLLFALKSGDFRAVYRWLNRDYAALFAGLPERTRLQRLLQVHHSWCARGTWNERMLVETALSLVTMVCHLKKVFHRTRHHFQARLEAYLVALFNAILGLNRRLEPDAAPHDRLYHFAQFAL